MSGGRATAGTWLGAPVTQIRAFGAAGVQPPTTVPAPAAIARS